VKLKTGKFQSEMRRQLNFYVALIADALRCKQHNETIVQGQRDIINGKPPDSKASYWSSCDIPRRGILWFDANRRIDARSS
jgi:hypothetical protein